jgi:hypothetical protein
MENQISEVTKYWTTTGISAFSTLLASVALIWNYLQHKKIEKLKGEQQKQINIHKLQFEKEFEIYNELWLNLHSFKTSIYKLRGIYFNQDKFDYADIPQIISYAKDELSSEYSHLIKNVEAKKPFYSHVVYSHLQKCLELYREEIMNSNFYAVNNKHHYHWDEEKKILSKVLISVDGVCNAVKSKIGLKD